MPGEDGRPVGLVLRAPLGSTSLPGRGLGAGRGQLLPTAPLCLRTMERASSAEDQKEGGRPPRATPLLGLQRREAGHPQTQMPGLRLLPAAAVSNRLSTQSNSLYKQNPLTRSHRGLGSPGSREDVSTRALQGKGAWVPEGGPFGAWGRGNRSDGLGFPRQPGGGAPMVTWVGLP